MDGRITHDGTVSVRAITLLRQRFFADGQQAARYGVSFQHLMQHLWYARRATRRFRLRDVEHINDLAHAVACVRMSRPAWRDLTEQHEGHLIRACTHALDNARAAMLVRRLFIDLRADLVCRSSDQSNMPTLREYHGMQPLSQWLTHRVLARLGECSPTLQCRRPAAMIEILDRPPGWSLRVEDVIEHNIAHGQA